MTGGRKREAEMEKQQSAQWHAAGAAGGARGGGVSVRPPARPVQPAAAPATPGTGRRCVLLVCRWPSACRALQQNSSMAKQTLSSACRQLQPSQLHQAPSGRALQLTACGALCRAPWNRIRHPACQGVVAQNPQHASPPMCRPPDRAGIHSGGAKSMGCNVTG